MKRSHHLFLLIAAILCSGAFFWGLSTGIKQQDTWKPVTPQAIPSFQVMVLEDGTPKMVNVLAVPEGATFYVDRGQEDAVIQTMRKNFDTRVRIQQRSSSRSEHEVILERDQDGVIAKFYYRASRKDITPLGWSQLDSSAFGHGATRGLMWALVALVVWSVLFFLSNRGSQAA